LIPFIKAHACGNDFLIVDAAMVPVARRSKVALQMCERNIGVGADGVEYLQWTGERSVRIQLFNADGSIAEISGNGTRCVAAWMAHEKNAVAGDSLTITTDAGVRECRIVMSDGRRFEIETAMGVPVVAARTVMLSNGIRVDGALVSMGNPHLVTFVDDSSFSLAGASWQEIGREICFHSDFPRQTNVEFVFVINPGEIEIRIFERGVGPTTSSGTGTCASAAAAIALRGIRADLLVTAPGGSQRVHWAGAHEEMTLVGPAELIAAGETF
jgi:diaminopimelate epimerase